MALEKNRNDARLWLNYLILYKNHQSDADDEKLPKMIKKALEFVESFELYWILWDFCKNIDENLNLYEKMASFLTKNVTDVTSGQIFRSVLRMTSVYAKNDRVFDSKRFLNVNF